MDRLAKESSINGRHRRAEVETFDRAGRRFQIKLRQNLLDSDDYSAILVYVRERASIILRRHNGPSHTHSNPIEQTAFEFATHRHFATHRYQARRFRAEHYAEPTDDFMDLASALTCMLAECGYEPGPQTTIYDRP